ncbi:MAG: heparan-alpha-glucosaminide N-acetyltransferase domain-containing protein [Thermoanaerobaculia bacterium]|nr:heparan-alpha-glucosaminide N-acetyltransferase domain-containing protein [Thermoanaerobaculia bacterium]
MGETPLRRQRLLSVDVFRGMTILAMILVNNPGDWGTVYWPLLHASWHGCTPTDLIFPFFLFIVGVSIVLALKPRLDDGTEPRSLVSKIIRRALILFSLGLFLSGFPFGLFGPKTLADVLHTWRIPGVLQRIAVCYLAASLLFVFGRRRILVGWTLACLFGYWAAMTLIPVPGQGAPDLDSKGGHLAGWLDRTVLGSHLWVGGRVYDPEGLLSTLPALATTLLGVWAGLLLIENRDPLERNARLFVNGWILILVGYVWSWFLPLNKALWTSSYAVLTAGLAMSFLALCHWWFDLHQHPRTARPFVLYGVNAITVFVGSGLLGRVLANLSVGDVTVQKWLYGHLFLTWLPPYVASLAYALTWVGSWYVVLVWMYRRGYVLKV